MSGISDQVNMSWLQEIEWLVKVKGGSPPPLPGCFEEVSALCFCCSSWAVSAATYSN